MDKEKIIDILKTLLFLIVIVAVFTIIERITGLNLGKSFDNWLNWL